jgi:hypothetical protein
MFHIIAHIETVDAAGAYNDLTPALGDQTIRTQGDRSFIPAWPNLVALACGVGSGGQGNARIETPSLLANLGRFYVGAVNGRNDGHVVADSPHKINDRRANPLPLKVGEGLLATIHSDTTAAARQWAVLFLSDGPIVPDVRPCFTMRGTGTTTVVALTWSNAPITFDENIPRGRYAIVGMRARGVSCIAARLVLPGLANRAGVLGCTAQTDLEHPMQRHGGLGVFGEWEDTDSFNVEFLCGAADTAQTVEIDFVKVRDGAGGA